MENKENTIAYPLITPEQYEENYNYGLVNASPFIEKKTIKGKTFHYLSWAFAMRWLGSHYPHLQVCFNAETGDEVQGFYVNCYILNVVTGFQSPPMELAILDWSNKVICAANPRMIKVGGEEKAVSTPLIDDICNTRQRARVKAIATYLGMGLHLYEGFGDVLSADSKAATELKTQAHDINDQQQSKKEQIDNVIKYRKRLKDESLKNYVEPKLINNKAMSELSRLSFDEVSNIAAMQAHYYGVCKFNYLLDEYKRILGSAHEYEQEEYANWKFDDLVSKGKELRDTITANQTPGME